MTRYMLSVHSGQTEVRTAFVIIQAKSGDPKFAAQLANAFARAVAHTSNQEARDKYVDTYKAFEMAPKVLAGIVNVNSPTVNDEIHAPMGGVRDSGWGRTGPESLNDFTDVIWINAHTDQRQYPF